MSVDFRLSSRREGFRAEHMVGMGMGINDRLNRFGGYLPEFSQDFGCFFHSCHGVNYDQSVRALDHDGIGDAVTYGHVEVVSDLFHAFLEYFAMFLE